MHARDVLTENASATQHVRDARIDFFRGLALIIIFMNHTPHNVVSEITPSRWGFSDAAEIFVFCSGLAAAIAYGRLYDRRGVLMTSARIAQRCWQIYWAHVCLFLLIVALLVICDRTFASGGEFVKSLNLTALFDQRAESAWAGLVTLTYVPNGFDILPMYLVLLALLPIVLMLRNASLAAVFVFVAGLWFISANLALPAEPWSTRAWFFNPFAWQLIFFLGFAFARGWIPAPPVDHRLILAAAAFVLISIPFAYWPLIDAVPGFKAIHKTYAPFAVKTDLGALRIAHFLCCAYLAYALAGPLGRNLTGPLVNGICTMGRQALSVFLVGSVLAVIGGIVFKLAGQTVLTSAIVNIGGIYLLYATAQCAAWFKSAPWKLSPASKEQEDHQRPLGLQVPANDDRTGGGPPRARPAG